jgi:hypothetical protein
VNKDGIKSFAIGPLGLLVLTLALFFDVLFLPGDAVLSSVKADLAGQFVHWRAFGFGEMSRGNLPLWNPHIYCGTPFHAGFQSALLYPLNTIYLVLPLAKAINWEIALHAFLGGFFTWLWMYRRGLHPLACFLAGAEFILCAPWFLHIYAGHLPNLGTMAWAPLLFMALDGALERPSVGWCLAGSLAVAMQILAGHIQYVYYTGIAACVYLALSLPGAASRLQGVASLLLFYAGGAVLAAAQILPGIEAGRESLRGFGVPYEFAAMFSFPPENLLTWVVPSFFGDHVRFPYWGRWFLWEMSLFSSVTGFLLALHAVFFREGRERLVAATAAGILLLLAMGSGLPWFGLLLDWLPGFDKFRGVSKFIFPASLFVILLSAMGLDGIIREGLRRRWLVLSVLGAGALLSLATGMAIRHSVRAPSGAWAEFMRAIEDTGNVYLPPEFFSNGLAVAKAGEFAALGLLILSATCAAVAAILFLRIPGPRKALLLVALAVVELLAAAVPHRATFRLPDAYPAGLTAAFSGTPGETRILNPVKPNLAMSMGWHDIWGRDPMIPRRYGEFTAWLQQVDMLHVAGNEFSFRRHPLLGMLRCGPMLTIVDDGLELVDSGGKPMPRVSLVGRWAVEPRRDGAFAVLGQPDFDTRRLVVLERDPKLPSGHPSGNPGTVRVTEASSDELTIEADVSTPTILVVTDNYTEGWRIVPLEGSASQSYEIIPANYTLRGVPLAPGHHRLRMEYRPASFVIGAWVSLAGLGAWMGAAGMLLWRRRRPGDSDAEPPVSGREVAS